MISSSTSSCRQVGIPFVEEEMFEQGPGDDALKRRLVSAGRRQRVVVTLPVWPWTVQHTSCLCPAGAGRRPGLVPGEATSCHSWDAAVGQGVTQGRVCRRAQWVQMMPGMCLYEPRGAEGRSGPDSQST